MDVRILFPFVLLLLSAVPAAAQSNSPFFEPVQPPRSTQIVAHCGMSMLAPENSVRAVLECANDYIEWATIDVRLSKDGQHVIIHDAELERCTDGKGKVAEFDLAKLKQFDAGSWFAPRFKGTRLTSLPEMLAAARGKVNLC